MCVNTGNRADWWLTADGQGHSQRQERSLCQTIDSRSGHCNRTNIPIAPNTSPNVTVPKKTADALLNLRIRPYARTDPNTNADPTATKLAIRNHDRRTAMALHISFPIERRRQRTGPWSPAAFRHALVIVQDNRRQPGSRERRTVVRHAALSLCHQRQSSHVTTTTISAVSGGTAKLKVGST